MLKPKCRFCSAKSVFGLTVALKKAVVGYDFWKSIIDKAAVGWMKNDLVELLWLWEKSPHFQAGPTCHAHMGFLPPLARSQPPDGGRRLAGCRPPELRLPLPPQPLPHAGGAMGRGEGRRRDFPATDGAPLRPPMPRFAWELVTI